MAEQSLLIGISQLAIVFSGLISVFIAFAARDGQFPPAERQHIRGLLLSSFPAVIAALTPFVFEQYDISEDWVWRGSSIAVLVMATPFCVENFFYYLRLTKAEKRANGYIHASFAFGLNFLIFVLLSLSALGIAVKANYIVSILLVILTGISSFVTFAAQRFLGMRMDLQN